MKKEAHIVAVVGMTGAGKSITADYLTTRGYQFLRFGQITLDIVKKKGLEPTEENERVIREGLRKEHGMAAFAIMNKEKIDKMLKKGNVVIDGLYSWAEYKFLKKEYGDKLIVLAVLAPAEVRYQRLDERKIVDEKMRHRPATKEQAISRDYAEIEHIEKAGPIAMADIVVENTGYKDELIARLRYLFHENSENRERRPSWDEYFMKMAALVGERSTCTRHHIGAVIVRNKRVLTTGYNGAVSGAEDCSVVGCKKDELKLDSGYGSEECRAVHAEQNAIIQAAIHGLNIYGASMYLTTRPCRMCAKELVNAGIKEIITYSEYAGAKGSIEFLEKMGVKIRQVDRPNPIIKFRD